MPRQWLYVLLADRFGGWPGEYARMPADELQPWLSLLNVEGRVAALWEGLGPEDDVSDEGDDD